MNSSKKEKNLEKNNRILEKNKIRAIEIIKTEIPPKCSNFSCENFVFLKVRALKWSKYCSKKCEYSLTMESNEKLHGVRSMSSLPDVKNKVKATNLERYGVEYLMQDSNHFEMVKQINLERHGAEFPSKLNHIKEKTKNTNIIRFGGVSPISSEEVHQKMRDSMLEKYGVEFALQNIDCKKKMERTNLERYGSITPQSLDFFKEKAQITNLENHGGQHSSSTLSVQEARKTTSLSLYRGPFHTYQNYTDTGIHLMSDEGFLDLVELNKIYTLPYIANLHGMSPSALHQRFSHNGVEVKRHFSSSLEESIADFIRDTCPDLELIRRTRTTIKGMELDIYLPDISLAIECNGTYWHSELNGKDKNYHINKSIKCEKAGIRLIHVWEHDWKEHRKIIQSILINALNGAKTKIFSRKCTISRIEDKIEESNFLNSNHIQGYVKSQVAYGLYNNNILIALMSFGKSRFSKKNEWELLRFCVSTECSIVGGASRLFKKFVSDIDPMNVISYSHIHLFSGKLYTVLGFKKIRRTKPSYYYIKDYDSPKNRMKFQKHKLERLLDDFDNSLTEWENMKRNNWDRFWDCGCDVWEWTRS